MQFGVDLSVGNTTRSWRRKFIACMNLEDGEIGGQNWTVSAFHPLFCKSMT